MGALPRPRVAGGQGQRGGDRAKEAVGGGRQRSSTGEEAEFIRRAHRERSGLVAHSIAR
jgi:hypothetical protein